MNGMLLDLRIKRRQMKEKAWMWLAWKLPKTLVMWASVRLISYATVGEYGSTIVPELSAMDALKRWNASD